MTFLSLYITEFWNPSESGWYLKIDHLSMEKDVELILELPYTNPAVIPTNYVESKKMLLVYFPGLGLSSTIPISRRSTVLPSLVIPGLIPPWSIKPAIR
jgi:hypothetical protein